jgi:hypothetical protein
MIRFDRHPAIVVIAGEHIKNIARQATKPVTPMTDRAQKNHSGKIFVETTFRRDISYLAAKVAWPTCCTNAT